jgi:hypothetical protein
MKYIKIYKHLLLLISTSILYPVLCTSNDSAYYTVEEANNHIISAFLLNDVKCNMGHIITLPIFAKVEKKGTDLCVLKILSLNCSEWAAANPVPLECAGILTRFK